MGFNRVILCVLQWKILIFVCFEIMHENALLSQKSSLYSSYVVEIAVNRREEVYFEILIEGLYKSSSTH